MTITEALGFAMGVLGLSLEDFCALTPNEFASVCKSYHEMRDIDTSDAWKRMRLLACICIQPHVKNKVTPEKLLPLPWDMGQKAKTEAKKVSKEEARARFEKLMKRTEIQSMS